MGYLFSDTHERLNRAQRSTEEALIKTREANEKVAWLDQKTLELDDLKSQFFSNVSHELRAPLRRIMRPLSRRLAAAEMPNTQRREDGMMLRSACLDVHLQGCATLYGLRYRFCIYSVGVKRMRGRGQLVERDEAGVPLRMVGPVTDISSCNAELKRFNRATVGREPDMIDLKRQVNTLAVLLGQEAPFSLALIESDTLSRP